MQYDVNKIREDFPILARSVYGKPLVYLDNGRTVPVPDIILDDKNRTHTALLRTDYRT